MNDKKKDYLFEQGRGTRPDERGLIFVVDDDRSLCALLERWLGNAGHRTARFHDGESCLAGLKRHLPSSVCLDLGLPGLSGGETLERIKAHHPLLPVVVMTADDKIESVVTTMQRGAYDYLVKPIDRTKLLTTLKLAGERHSMSMRLTELEREVEGGEHFGMIGASPPMKELFRQLDRVAASDVNVLVHGESGTGKELVARGIHDHSSRGQGTFVAVNCAAIPESLEESELLGHEKGAFTGATARHLGYLERAHQGTLFLDEVGELGSRLQAKLLRVLEERRFQRVGGSAEVASDFRLVAATHRDLEHEVRAGRFREDLFYRLAVYELGVVPLRERGGDVQLLADRFLDELASSEARRRRLSPAAREALTAYSWPGNIRELRNALHRAHLVAGGELIEAGDLPGRVLQGGGAGVADDRPVFDTGGETRSVLGDGLRDPNPTLAQIEREVIREAVRRNNGNLSAVGRQLEIGRTTLYRKLAKYELR